RGQAIGGGDGRDDQLRRVTERRVQEAADPGTGVVGQVVRRLADQPGKRDQRHAGKQEQGQVAAGAEPIQNHDEGCQQQRQERASSDVPTGPRHTVTLLGDAGLSASTPLVIAALTRAWTVFAVWALAAAVLAVTTV